VAVPSIWVNSLGRDSSAAPLILLQPVEQDFNSRG
jgi:hypothetical protein